MSKPFLLSISRYIGLAVSGFLLVCLCVALMIRDIRLKGGFSLAFLKQHQTVILGICTIFSLGNPSFTNSTIRGHSALPSSCGDPSRRIIHRTWDPEVHLLLPCLLVLLQGSSWVSTAQGEMADLLKHSAPWRPLGHDHRVSLSDSKRLHSN